MDYESVCSKLKNYTFICSWKVWATLAFYVVKSASYRLLWNFALIVNLYSQVNNILLTFVTFHLKTKVTIIYKICDEYLVCIVNQMPSYCCGNLTFSKDIEIFKKTYCTLTIGSLGIMWNMIPFLWLICI